MPAAVSPDLIELAKGGDHHAFRKIVEAHQGFAYAVAFRFVGNRSEAEDTLSILLGGFIFSYDIFFYEGLFTDNPLYLAQATLSFSPLWLLSDYCTSTS